MAQATVSLGLTTLPLDHSPVRNRGASAARELSERFKRGKWLRRLPALGS